MDWTAGIVFGPVMWVTLGLLTVAMSSTRPRVARVVDIVGDVLVVVGTVTVSLFIVWLMTGGNI